QFVPVTRKIVRTLRESTSLPLIVKGIMVPEDAELAVELGADGIVVSNHGGRILDEGEATLDVLPEIVRDLKSKRRYRRAEVFFDGGIRKGTDILKALALGAKGCLIGRPIFWGLAVNNKDGPLDIMRILSEELTRAAALCGVASIAKVDSSVLRTAPSPN
ncbi:MAG: alpha-hydroxy acid oxidase, partial [Nitrososphaerales archaeon]